MTKSGNIPGVVKPFVMAKREWPNRLTNQVVLLRKIKKRFVKRLSKKSLLPPRF